MLVEFYDHYVNNEHGPGPLEAGVTAYLEDLVKGELIDGVKAPFDLGEIVEDLQKISRMQVDVYQNVISLTQVHPGGTPLHHWRALLFKEINHDQTQTEHGPLPPLPDGDRVEARP